MKTELMVQEVATLELPKLKLNKVRKIIYSNKQKQSIKGINTGLNQVIIGAAGTGKTTALTADTMDKVRDKTFQPLLMKPDSYYLKRGLDPEHNHLTVGAPVVIFVTFTNPAVGAIRTNLDTEGITFTTYDRKTGETFVCDLVPSMIAITMHVS